MAVILKRKTKFINEVGKESQNQFNKAYVRARQKIIFYFHFQLIISIAGESVFFFFVWKLNVFKSTNTYINIYIYHFYELISKSKMLDLNKYLYKFC